MDNFNHVLISRTPYVDIGVFTFTGTLFAPTLGVKCQLAIQIQLTYSINDLSTFFKRQFLLAFKLLNTFVNWILSLCNNMSKWIYKCNEYYVIFWAWDVFQLYCVANTSPMPMTQLTWTAWCTLTDIQVMYCVLKNLKRLFWLTFRRGKRLVLDLRHLKHIITEPKNKAMSRDKWIWDDIIITM